MFRPTMLQRTTAGPDGVHRDRLGSEYSTLVDDPWTIDGSSACNRRSLSSCNFPFECAFPIRVFECGSWSRIKAPPNTASRVPEPVKDFLKDLRSSVGH
jgi:hypothetical protein